MRIPSGKTDQRLYFVAYDATDLITRKTGLSSFTVYRSRNADTATVYTTPTVDETDSTNMPGVYSLLVDEDTTIEANSNSEEYVVHITATGMAPVTRTVELYRFNSTTDIADGILNRDMATGTDSGSTTVRTVRQALRALRNKWTVAAGTYTVYKEDDTTSSWTGATTSDAAADPITANDPAGP